MIAYLSAEAVFAAVRKCSLILEEAQDVSDDDDGDDDFRMDSMELKPSRSLEFLDERTSDLSASASQELGLSPASGSGSLDDVKPPYPLKTVCSSPQLLNQIQESELEHECLPSGLAVQQGHYSHGKMAVPEMLGKYDRLRHLRGVGSNAGTAEGTRRLQTSDSVRAIFMHKCDALSPRQEFHVESLNYTQHHSGASVASPVEKECLVEGGSGREGIRSERGDIGNTKCDYSQNHCEQLNSSDASCDVLRTAGEHMVASETGSACVGAGCENSSPSSSRGSNSRSDLQPQQDVRTCSERRSLITEAAQDLQMRILSGVSAREKSRFQNKDSQTAQNLQTLSSRDESGTRNRDPPTVPRTQDLQARKPSGVFSRDEKGSSKRDSSPAPANQDLQTRAPSALSSADESETQIGDSPTTITNNNNNVITLTSSSLTAGSSIAPAACTAQYNGQYPSHRKDLPPGSRAVEFSEISDCCDCMDEQAKVSACLGDCGLPSSSHQSSRQGHSKQNGMTSSFCKVGSGSPVVQIESKCCSVV
ncbi:unnamed protein product [Candidula unifasciata]|uniref:Uncharacterized protein n=1 Tax=Candidula unifasciata TaxID=100452 RepID=A0A8S3ZCC7_9EUPU|nr:unnamed protein product [Candidula unifasciata]